MVHALGARAVMPNAGGAFLLALFLVSSRLAKASWLPIPTQKPACVLHLTDPRHLAGEAMLPFGTGFLSIQKKC